MTDDGQITIPADIRRRLNWTPGGELYLHMATANEANPANEIFVQTANATQTLPVRERKPFLGVREGIRRYVEKYGRDGRTTDEIMAELREGERE